MKTTFTVRHMVSNELIEHFFQEKVTALSKHLKRFRDELIFLHAALEKNPHKDEYFATVSLFLPIGALHCRERSVEASSALSLAFSDIARQIEKHKAKLIREKRRQAR